MKNNFKNLALSRKILLTVYSALVLNLSFLAQTSSINLNINYRLSGNGFGAMIIPQATFNRNLHEFSLGLNIQKKQMNISGFQTGYNFLLYQGSVGIFAFYDLSYLKKCCLGKSLEKMESSIKPEYASYYESVRMSAIDQHIGFGIRFLKGKFYYSFASIGAGVSCTKGSYNAAMFRTRDRCSSSLLINLGINLKIYRKTIVNPPEKFGKGRL